MSSCHTQWDIVNPKNRACWNGFLSLLCFTSWRVTARRSVFISIFSWRNCLQLHLQWWWSQSSMTFDYTFLCLSLSVSGVIFQSLCATRLSFASFYAIQKKKLKCFQWPSACSHWWVRRVRLWDSYRHPAGWLLLLFQSLLCPNAYRCAEGYITGASLLSCGFIESDIADMLQGMVCMCVLWVFVGRITLWGGSAFPKRADGRLLS